MTDKERIKQWISREQDGLMDAQGNFASREDEGAYHILCSLDNYIDSMNKEPVSEDLEEAAIKYAGIPEDSPHDLKYCVQDKKAKYDAVLYGANWQKQQMTKDAVETIVDTDANGIACVNVEGVKPGDKVKVLIIKED